jgi:hypothetical protein
MNKIISLVAFLIIINAIFSFVPFMFPRAQKEIILPYQLWFNTLGVFILILPNQIGF